MSRETARAWTDTTSLGELDRGNIQMFEDGSLADMPHGVILEVPLGTFIASTAMIVRVFSWHISPQKT